MKRKCMLAMILVLQLYSTQAIVPASEKLRLEKNWYFLRSDLGSIWETVRPKQKEDVPLWEKVTLPHCYNAYDAVDPTVNYYQGIGWYT